MTAAPLVPRDLIDPTPTVLALRILPWIPSWSATSPSRRRLLTGGGRCRTSAPRDGDAGELGRRVTAPHRMGAGGCRAASALAAQAHDGMARVARRCRRCGGGGRASRARGRLGRARRGMAGCPSASRSARSRSASSSARRRRASSRRDRGPGSVCPAVTCWCAAAAAIGLTAVREHRRAAAARDLSADSAAARPAWRPEKRHPPTKVPSSAR